MWAGERESFALAVHAYAAIGASSGALMNRRDRL